ncbi:MAG: DUF1700 domain-containing protein [Lachnospiraceae bacterium]|nr:DUF1700 domain-containing protein [Lachnospiraceae bacterium]
MNKETFLAELRNALRGFPEEDIEERVAFYSEMIDDRMEEGLTEEDAIAQTGAIQNIVSQTIADTPLHKLVKENARTRKPMSTGEIVLLVVGSPLWLALGIAFLAVMLALYIILWALVVVLWAIEVSFIVSALACVASAVYLFTQGESIYALMALGAGLFLAGLSIFLFFGCVSASKGIVKLTGKIAVGIKSLFIRKENAR